MNLNLNSFSVLVVNRSWMPLGTTTIRNAIKSLFSSPNGNSMAARPFLIEYEQTGEDTWNFENPIVIKPIDVEEWLNLNIRPFDRFISSAKQKVRIPTVIQAVNCDKTHLRDIKLTRKNILERDGDICQYTNKKLPRSQLNIDHVISRDEWKRRGLAGSPDNWENMVACDKRINSLKGNKSAQEVGLSLIRKPKKPLPVPASAMIKEVRNKDWEIFLLK